MFDSLFFNGFMFDEFYFAGYTVPSYVDRSIVRSVSARIVGATGAISRPVGAAELIGL